MIFNQKLSEAGDEVNFNMQLDLIKLLRHQRVIQKNPITMRMANISKVEITLTKP